MRESVCARAHPDMERSHASATMGGVMAHTIVFCVPRLVNTVASVAPTNTRYALRAGGDDTVCVLGRDARALYVPVCVCVCVCVCVWVWVWVWVYLAHLEDMYIFC